MQLPTTSLFIDYMDYIKTFPINDDPELFGLHPNADITFAQSQTYKCLSTLLLLQPKMVGGAASSQEEVTTAVSKNILEQMPKLFNLDLISQRFLIQLIYHHKILYNHLAGTQCCMKSL